MGYIYKLTNDITKRAFIGHSFKDISFDSLDIQHQPHLQYDIKEYHLSNFTLETIIICFDEDVEYYCQYYIKKYCTRYPFGYNNTRQITNISRKYERYFMRKYGYQKIKQIHQNIVNQAYINNHMRYL